ncbi:hypothetical protein [Polyangium mundeleinium]|uniref:Lipoprotein n=1 Tax=Polyangium mundeleinium TaxID=2995306 RepID=A0ABT5EX58_9BACT|nr:hypothetical protein [Polyangium mundeleinium]MDC0745773.1 hypothetical protein [Polyangium mundeleinium]
MKRTHEVRPGSWLAVGLLLSLVAASCGRREERGAEAGYDPLARAREAAGRVRNPEASVPPLCYTKTHGTSNPCWVCHTSAHGPNTRSDGDLQVEYSFSETALKNHYENLFVDRRADMVALSDEEILRYVREDNYGPLRRALLGAPGFEGYVPDLDLERGFDEQGFAKDGSGYRAVRYKPFPGAFWPTNGSTDDVFLRLPELFRKDMQGATSRAIYMLNLSLLEAAIASDPDAPPDRIDRRIEPVDERLLGFDLDGDGALAPGVTRVRRLPKTYAGGASSVPLERGLYPRGVEFLHSVRYLDPDAPGFAARRMKELRYARKVLSPDRWALLRAQEKELDEKDEGLLPVYTGSAMSGLRNAFGWQLQGFIEDEAGRLRLSTDEEHRFCMGCHSSLGVTVDQTFSFARKVPGEAGWRVQDIRGMPDVPQLGQADPEVLVYLRRVGGGDELRANDEMTGRFFPGGTLAEAEVRRAAPGGDRDLAFLLLPSRARALALDKAYRVLVRGQRFDLGRDALPTPAANVHATITNGSTGLEEANRVYRDGRLRLDWGATATSSR